MVAMRQNKNYVVYGVFLDNLQPQLHIVTPSKV